MCDAGLAAARATAAAGVSELELWTAVRGAMEGSVHTRLPVLADLVAGPRTADVGGPPSARVMRDGDLDFCDLVPRVGGYWGDSRATFAIGEPSASARAAHARARETLAEVIAAIRPGRGGRRARRTGSRSSRLSPPHGHGLGTGYHEEPRLIPGSTTVLEEGMVVAIEPGVYAEFGVRVEQVVVITREGCEILSGHDLDL